MSLFSKKNLVNHTYAIVQSQVSGTVKGGASTKVRKLARRLLGKGDRDMQLLQVVEPPPEYLQEDVRIRHPQLPHEFMNMLKNIK